MTITTGIGYKVNIDKDKVLDYEFSYLIGALQTDTPEEALKDNTLLLNKLLGSKEEVFKFFAFIKEKNNGVVDQKIVTDSILEMITALGNGKKK
ncbi:MAG: hypothetical protein KBT03_10865 [Bacteroidales bacterium]|nr:hypothetical protein [Candidatus Scybalousia scybalohippi]